MVRWVRALLWLLLVLGILVGCEGQIASPENSDCGVVSENLHACSGIIEKGVMEEGPLLTDCCNGLRRIQDAQASLGVPKTCQCAKACLLVHILQPASPPAPAVRDDVDSNLVACLPMYCGITLGFNLSKNVAC